MHRKSFCADDYRNQKEYIQKTIETYSPMVYRLAYSLVKNRSDADDIHQEVFLRFIKYQPRFESEEHAKFWFIRVTTNQCKNWWKLAWRRVISLSEYEEENRGVPEPGCVNAGVPEPGCMDAGVPGAGYENSGGSGFGYEEKKSDRDIIEVVKALPRKYRVVIHLFYYEQMKAEEIAKTLGIKASTVRTRLTRARRKMSEILKEDI